MFPTYSTLSFPSYLQHQEKAEPISISTFHQTINTPGHKPESTKLTETKHNKTSFYFYSYYVLFNICPQTVCFAVTKDLRTPMIKMKERTVIELFQCYWIYATTKLTGTNTVRSPNFIEFYNSVSKITHIIIMYMIWVFA